jgi:hypothetical protein
MLRIRCLAEEEVTFTLNLLVYRVEAVTIGYLFVNHAVGFDTRAVVLYYQVTHATQNCAVQ